MKVSPGADGSVRVRLVAPEADTLASLLTDLVAALRPGGLDPDDPVHRRLYPDGYRDNAEAAEAFRSLTESTLREERLERAEQCLTGLAAAGGSANHKMDVTLEAEAAERWLRVINDMRLAIGTRIGITEDGGLHRFVNVYVNDEDVRFTGSLETALNDGDAVTVLPAVAGGAALS